MTTRIATLFLAACLLAVAFTTHLVKAQPSAAVPAGSLYVATFVDVIPTGTTRATAAIQRYVSDSRKEQGSVRVEAIAQDGRTNHLVIFEVWQDKASFDAHEGSATTRDFRAALVPLLGAPFDQRLHHLVP